MNKFEQKELVVLKPEFDDNNCKRIYIVEEIIDDCLKVKVKSANIINKDKYKEADLLIGQEYEAPTDYFEPFM
jgi:hypothetical protein